MGQIRVLYRLVATITCLVCLGFSVGTSSSESDALIKPYVSSSSLPSNENLVYSAKLKVHKVTGSEWESLVIKSKDLCVACRSMESVLNELESLFKDRFKFYTLNVDAERGIDMQYKILSVPTTVVFKGGDEVARVPGFQPGEVYRLVEKYM